MTYRPTILNLSTGIFLTGILIYTIWNYKTLSAGEGWGIVATLVLMGFGVIAAIADLILQILIKSQTAVNIIGLIIVVGVAIAIPSDT